MKVENQNQTKIYTINTKQLEEALCSGNEVRHKMCLIVGPNGYVLTDNECIHFTPRKHDAPVTLSVWEKKEGFITIFPKWEVNVSLPQLIEFSTDETPDWKNWIHYFGIKTRMFDNLKLLKKSLKEIGAVVEFPQW